MTSRHCRRRFCILEMFSDVMWNSSEMKMEATPCTVIPYLQDVPEDDLEHKKGSITIFSPVSSIHAGLNPELPNLSWKMETIKCTRQVSMEDVFSYVCDSDETFSQHFETQTSIQLGSNPKPLAMTSQQFSLLEKYITGNHVIAPVLNRENLVIAFWINSVSSHDSFRVEDHGDLLKTTCLYNCNNNSDDKSDMRLISSDKALTKNRLSKSEHTVSSNAKHSYKSRRRPSYRYRITDQVPLLPAIQCQAPKAEAKHARVPSAEAKYAPVTSAEAKYAPVPSAEAKYAPVPSAEAKYAPVTSAEAKYAPVTSAEAKYAPVTSAEAKYAPVPSAEAKYAPVPSAEAKYAPVPSAEAKYAPVPSAETKQYAPIPSAEAKYAPVPSAEAKYAPVPSAEAKYAPVPSAEAKQYALVPSAEAKYAPVPSAEAKYAPVPSAEAKQYAVVPSQSIQGQDPSAQAIYGQGLSAQEQNGEFPLAKPMQGQAPKARVTYASVPSIKEIDSYESLEQRIKRKKTLRDLCVEISKYKKASEVPQKMKNKIFQEFFTPFLNGGFDPEVSVLQNLTGHPGVMSDSVVHDGNSQLVDEISTPELLDKKGSALSQNVNPGLYGVATANPAFNPSEMLIFTDEADAVLEESPINQALLNNSLEAETDDNPVDQFSLGQRTQQNVFSGFNTDTYKTPESSADVFIDKTPFSSEEVHKTFFGTLFAMSREFSLLQPPTLPNRKIKILTEEDGSDCILGKGCFGQVAEAEMKVYPNTVQQVVVKEHFLDKSTQAQIVTEAKILMYLESTGCVPVCYGLLSDERGYWGMVSELFGSGVTLHDLLYENNVNELDWYEISHQLATCINKIHSMYVLVNDLKADNVLVDCSGPLPVVKICDMGSASHGAGVTFNDPNMNRFYHLAPEVRAFNLTSSANDVYGLGQILKKIYQASSLSAFKSIYEQCLIENPKKRITMSNLLHLLSEAYSQELESYEAKVKALDEAKGRRKVTGSETRGGNVEVEGRGNAEDGVEDRRREEDVRGRSFESLDVERPCEIPSQHSNRVSIHKSNSREIILFKPAEDALSVQTHGIPLQKTTSREIMLFKPLYDVSASLQNSQFLNRDTSREKFQTTLYVEQHEISAGYSRGEFDAESDDCKSPAFETLDVHSFSETANDNLTTKFHDTDTLASELCDVDKLPAKTVDAKHPDDKSPASETPFAQSSASEAPFAKSSACEFPVIESPDTESSASDSADVLSADSKSSDAKTPVAKTTASEPPASQSPDAKSPTSESVDTESRDAESRDVESPVWFRCVRPLLLAIPVAVTAYVLYKASR